MTVFDAAGTGTPEADWARCPALLTAPEFAMTARRVLVLAAHPDDETLGAGALIVQAADRGLDVHVIIASDGAASHPRSTTHTPGQLAALRRAEATAALATLAPAATLTLLDLPDGTLAEHGERLDEALRANLTATTLLAAPWAYDRHPDHAACARAARRTGREMHLEYPIWAWHWADPDDDLLAVDPQAAGWCRVTGDGGRKRAAINCYPSQTQPLSPLPGDEAVVGDLAYFLREHEYHVQVHR